MKPYIAQIRSNLRLMGRDRSVLVLSYFFPLIFFFLFAQLYDAGKSPAAMAQVITMVLIIGVLGSGFFGAGMRAVQDRETNVLRRFKVAPINAAPIIVASLVSGLVSFLPTVVLFLLLARAVYHMPLPANTLSVLLFISLGLVAFRSMGMIVASVVNSAQEGQLFTQILYMPMLFLSGATFPVSIMPVWVQIIAQFLPATYLFQGLQSIMLGHESILANASAVAALSITLCVAVFVGVKLFRWEKEEKIKNSAKLWILAVLAPFFILGVYQAETKQSIDKAKILARNERRSRSFLIENAKIFIGNGKLIQGGAVLIRAGKIEQVYDVPPGDIKSLNAEVIDAAGKTLMPGLIDMHVHIGAPGGFYESSAQYSKPNLDRRRLAAYLFSGITAVRSTGDWLDNSIKLRDAVNSGEYLGAEFFACGPMFTTAGGHGTEYFKDLPDNMKKLWEKQFVRLPNSANEARTQVDDLKKAGVNGIKAVLESGNAFFGLFNHMDVGIYRAIVQEAIADHLAVATHTGNSTDVKDAVDAGTTSVEHGSMTDLIPTTTFEEMKQKGIAYDPTLTVFEASAALRTGSLEPLDRSLVQQVGPADLLASTKAVLQKRQKTPGDLKSNIDRLNQNLLEAYKTGVMLITGTDAGNPLVIHGPTIHRELQLWVKAGIPPAAALQAATYNAAKILCADDRIGSIQKGRDATLLLLEGDPLENITNTERIAMVMFRGERVDRSELFNQDTK
jgi:imidazolonepropionase-like amidohydrolase/ABC-type multidrug transport system permease subunit